MNSRALATLILNQVISHGVSLPEAMQKIFDKYPKAQDISLIKELCFGSLRWYFQLEAISEQLLHSPLQAKNKDIACLIIIGLYQILHLKVPDYAAVSETVAAAKQLHKVWAASLVNKILRSFIQKQTSILEKLQEEAAKYAHPNWLIDSIRQHYPQHWETILENNNAHPPLFLRINTQKTHLQEYQCLLKEKDIETDFVTGFPEALQVKKPVGVDKITGFYDGLCSVQDLAGQEVATLLNLKPGLRVLDACCAPGGKTAHILEKEPDLEKLVAIDKDPKRLIRVKDNIQRLKLKQHPLQLLLGDANLSKAWWDGQLFDRILLDAPCSATGVIRRHPDIKLLRQPTDIEGLIVQQQDLLKNLWPLLTVGGELIYTTCSILPEENEQAIARFLKRFPQAEAVTMNFEGDVSTQYGVQRLPQKEGHDGFFYAVLRKKPLNLL